MNLPLKNKLLIFILACLSASCTTKDGFTEGAFLQVQNGTGADLQIVFDNNAGVKDSIFCGEDAITLVPLDMYSRRMNFGLKGTSQRSLLSLDYTLVVRRQQRDIKLNIENVVPTLDTTINDHQFAIAETYDQKKVSTINSWDLSADDDWNFINNTSNVLYIR